ncbi:MAG: response regulator, partial [bacterium]
KHTEEIDLLMTDVIMPQMSGRELAERVVKMKAGVRVLYMSGYTDDVIVRHGELEAGTAFLQKPFTKEALGRKLRELLGG